MQQPEGFVLELGKVCKLNKSLYGLHQSGRQWFFEIDDTLLKLNFQKLNWCNCVYVFKNKLVHLLYVNDIIIFGKTKNDLEYGVDLLKKFFNLKFLGKTSSWAQNLKRMMINCIFTKLLTQKRFVFCILNIIFP